MQKILLIILSVSFSAALFAAGTDSTLVQAERFYQQAEYTQAIAQYESLVDSGLASATLFYNLGNAYFKNHDIKSAILYYERAKRLAPNDEAIDFNLQLSRTLIFDKVEALPDFFLVTWVKAVRDLLSVRGWSWLSICCFIAALATGLLFFFMPHIRIKRISFGLAVLCVILCIGAFIFGYLQKTNIERVDEAIVFAPSVTLKSSPDESGTNLFVLHEGVKIRIEDQVGEWCEIRIADGNKGWLQLKDIKVI